MKKLWIAPLVLAIALLFIFACNDPTIIGSELLEEDELDIVYTDTLTLNSYTTFGDSVRTYSSGFGGQLTSYLCGNFDDPVFGVARSSIYAQMRLNAGIEPGFSGIDPDSIELDSIVLVLPWLATGTYGDLSETHTLSVHQLEEPMDGEATYYSTDKFLFNTMPIGNLEFRPHPEDSTLFQPPGGDSDDTIRLTPQVRIRLDDFFANNFFSADTLNFENDTSFLEFFNGIHIQSTTLNKGMLSFNLRSAFAGLQVFYHKGDEYSSYLFPMDAESAKMTSFQHDYNQSIVKSFIEQPEIQDSVLFIQGMAGVDAVIEIPYASLLGDVIINKAELELTIVELPEDNEFDLADPLIISEVQEDGTLTFIEDVEVALGGNFEDIFGGSPENGLTFTLNISAHLREMIRGNVTNKMQISLFAKSEKASRVIVAGSKHSETPIQLRVSYTKF